MLTQIPIKLPWSFDDALGYHGGFRWVAFFWEPCGDEAMYDDGFCSADCNWEGFLKFTHHPNVRPWLYDYNLGSTEDAADHWLLCDLQERDVLVGDRAEVKARLIEEASKYVPGGVPADSRVVIPKEELGELLEEIRTKMQEVPAPSMAEIMEKRRKDQEAVALMESEL